MLKMNIDCEITWNLHNWRHMLYIKHNMVQHFIKIEQLSCNHPQTFLFWKIGKVQYWHQIYQYTMSIHKQITINKPIFLTLPHLGQNNWKSCSGILYCLHKCKRNFFFSMWPNPNNDNKIINFEVMFYLYLKSCLCYDETFFKANWNYRYLQDDYCRTIGRYKFLSKSL